MNTGKVVAGGLAAGLVINVVESVMNMAVLARPAEAMLEALGLPPVSGPAIAGFVIMGFAIGLAIVWTYAAIRPRFGPGPATALKAGLAVWVMFYLFAGVANWLMGIVSTRFTFLILGYSLVMMLAAGYVGGMVYKEEGTAV